MSIKKKHIIFVIAIIGAIITLIYIKPKSTDELIDVRALENAKYMVSVGEDLKEKSFLMLINKDGESTKPLKYDGMSIDSIVKNIDGEFFLHSKRLNRHYKISKGGKIDNFTLLKDKYSKEDWKGMGSWCANESKTGIIETMNIGGIKGRYLSNLLYSKKKISRKTEIVFKDGHPFAAIEKGEKIFVGTYFEKTDEMGLSVIDKSKGNLRKIKLNNKNATSSMKLISLGDKVIAYGDDAVMNRDDKKPLNTSITAVDSKNYNLKSIDAKNMYILIAYKHDGLLCLVTESGELRKYDANLRLISKIKIKKSELYKDINRNDISFMEHKTKETKNKIYTWSGAGKSDKELVGYIEEYDKRNLTRTQRIKVILSEKFNCLGDEFAFYVNP